MRPAKNTSKLFFNENDWMPENRHSFKQPKVSRSLSSQWLVTLYSFGPVVSRTLASFYGLGWKNTFLEGKIFDFWYVLPRFFWAQQHLWGTSPEPTNLVNTLPKWPPYATGPSLRVWILEVLRKAFQVSLSVSGSRLKTVFGYPHPVSSKISDFTPEISTDQDWIRTEANFGRTGLDRTAFFSKLADQDWIGLKKFFVVLMWLIWKYHKF